MIAAMHGDIIQWLRGFYYISEHGSIRRAAEVMNRTPSTLSYQLKCLEDELETILFVRENNRLKITPEGEKLRQWTISTFENLKSMKEELASKPGHLRGAVDVSITLPLATLLIDTIAEFHKAEPLVQINLRRSMVDGIIRDVEEGTADFGLISASSVPQNVVFEDIFTSRPLLILPKGHSFSLPDRPSFDDLRKLPMLSYFDKAYSDTKNGFVSIADVTKFCDHPPILRVNNFHLMLHFVMCGMGCALMDEICLNATLFGSAEREKIEYISMEHLFPAMRNGIIYKKRRLSPQSDALVNFFRQTLQKQPSYRA